MTLYTTDYLEYYLTLVAWVVNNGIWSILVASGVFALPFVAIVIQKWLKARSEGADEGNKGVLSSMRIGNRAWVAIVVIMFAGIPFIPVDLATIKFDTTRSAQCQVSVPLPNDTGWANVYTTLDNQSALVPVWWFFMHAISKAVTGAAVAAIPCGTDLRQIRMDVDATRIDDPVLAQEVADFTHDCYGPSRAKLFMNRPTLSDEQMNDVTWIGSSYFLDTPGFYDTYRAKTPRTAWPYDATRDAGLAQVDSGGGYPSCRQWWADGDQGLRSRLLAQVDPDLLTRIGRWAGFLSQSEVNDSVIRAVVSPRQQKMNQGAVYTDYGGQIDKTLPNVVTRGASDLGLTVGSLAFFPAMDVVRQALPMVLTMLKMALVICIPLVLLIGTYDLKTVVTVSAAERRHARRERPGADRRLTGLLPRDGRGAPGAADGADDAQDGARHLHPAGAADRHLRPEDGGDGELRPVRAVLRGLLVPARALDRQHDPGRALRLGVWRGQAARQLRSVDRPEQRVR